jgi:D-hydroxyproline dehydrogenase subunit beta
VSRRGSGADVAIIGGGIVGCALAAFLAEAGVRVRLYERAAIAAGASGRNSGIVQHPFDPVLAALYRASLDEYAALSADPDAAFALPAEPAGLLLVGRDRDRAEQLAADWRRAWPATAPEVLGGAELRTLEPALAPDLTACRLDVGYPVEPAGATLAFAAAALRAGAEIAIGRETRPAVVAGRVQGVEVDGVTAPAGQVVIAAGPWTPSAVAPGGTWQPIRPTWGVVASIELVNAPLHGMEAIDIEIEPAADGELDEAAPSEDRVDFSLVPGVGPSALGSTFLPTEPDPAEWLQALRAVGARYVPGVAVAPVVGLRHCARPVSLDGRPLAGPAPWCEGLWIAAGHGPWGISTGPGTARLLADVLLNRRQATAIPSELAVGRFGRPDQRQEFGSVR